MQKFEIQCKALSVLYKTAVIRESHENDIAAASEDHFWIKDMQYKERQKQST